MGYEKGEKLNLLQRILPSGLVVTAKWLDEKGYSSALLHKYVSKGWLEQPARGIYRRPAGQLLWQHVVISLQALLETAVVVGGRTVLELHGLSHYVGATGSREVHLYSDKALPGWVCNIGLTEEIVTHNSKRLFHKSLETISEAWNSKDQRFLGPLDQLPPDLVIQDWGQWDWPVVVSRPERAVFELLNEVPEHETFHQADMLIEGLRTLSPRRIQSLLEDCRSVKAKRLFLWFADRHQFPWLNELHYEHIDLGSGKRSLVQGGKLDSKYLITVPEDMHDD